MSRPWRWIPGTKRRDVNAIVRRHPFTPLLVLMACWTMNWVYCYTYPQILWHRWHPWGLAKVSHQPMMYRVTHHVGTNLPSTPKQRLGYSIWALFQKRNFCFDVNGRFGPMWCPIAQKIPQQAPNYLWATGLVYEDSFWRTKSEVWTRG